MQTEFLQWLEQTAFCSWIRDSGSLWAYPLVLSLHSAGMCVLVGLNWVVDLRLLGVARNIPIRAMEKWFPLMWVGFWLNLASGIVLLAADATTKLASWVFGLKMLFIVLAMLVLVKMQKLVRRMPVESPANQQFEFSSRVTHASGRASSETASGVALASAPADVSMDLSQGRRLAFFSLLFWTLSITAGRLMAYLGPVTGLN